MRLDRENRFWVVDDNGLAYLLGGRAVDAASAGATGVVRRETSGVSAVPFTVKRSSDLWDSKGYTTKTETAHGLVRLEADRLVIQWRLAVRTESMGGSSWSTNDEIEPVRQIDVPLRDVAGATVVRSRWGVLRAPRLTISAADLVAFDDIAGGQGLKLKHPARLVLRIKRADRLAAEEFAAEVALAVARLPGPVAARRISPA